jgi:hypothetical protein
MTHLESQFADLWVTLYPAIDLQSEYQFHPHRRYRWDFAHPTSKVAIDIQGGVWMAKSGHSGGTGLVKDYEKLNLAASLGWRVFLLAESMIDDYWLSLIAATTAQVSDTPDFKSDHLSNVPKPRSNDLLCQLIQDGLSNQEIIEQTGCLGSRISERRKVLGIRDPKRFGRVTIIEDLIRKGLTNKEIMERVGCISSRVSERRKVLGIPERYVLR